MNRFLCNFQCCDQGTRCKTKTEAAGFETEAKIEAVYLKTEAEAHGSWPI